MSHLIRGQGGHLVFSIGPKNTNLVENVEILLPVKFRKIPLGGFRGEVENVSANRRPERPSCFLSGFVKFHSAVSEENSKMSQLIRGQGGHLVFPIVPKNTNLVEDVEILLPVKFR